MSVTELIIDKVQVRILHDMKQVIITNQGKEPITLKYLGIIKRKLSQINKEANDYAVTIINAC